MSPNGRIMSKFKCCVLVLLTVCCTRASSEALKNGAPVQLPNPEQNVMPYEPVQYSQANISSSYKSSTKYNAKGMGHLYYITNRFLNFILKDQAYPEGFIRVEGGNMVVNKDWMSVAWHYRSLVLLVGVGLALSAVVPMAGLVFCCCRCAGKCGARTAPFDNRYDTCRRHLLGFLLSVLTTLILFGVVCAFVTNEQMEDGAKNLAPSVRTSLQDTDLYLNNTKLQVNTLLVTNFQELETVLDKLLHRSGEIVKDKLGEISKATVLANLTTIVSGLKLIRADLNNIDSLTKPLQEHAVSLESALREVRIQLLSRLETCRNERPCIDFLSKYNITALSLEANFTQLPDVTTSLHNVSALLADNIEEEVLKGKDQFDRIKYNIQTSVDRRIPEISKEISKAGQTLSDKAKNVTRILENIQNVLYKNSYEPVAQADSFLKQYAHYRYYMGLGMSSTLLIILCCIGFGLLCGYCGHRPDALYNDDCCDKGTASRCLILSVWLMLLTFSSLMVLCLVYLVTGSVADRVVCTSLRQPEAPNNAFTLIDNLVQLPPYSSNPPPLSKIIRECHHNSSVYKALELDLNSLSEYTSERFDIPARVRQLADSIVLTSEIQIITAQADRQLRALAASPLNTIDLTVYTSVLNEKITSIDLLQMAAALNQTAIRLPPSQSNVKTVLLNEAMYLEVHQDRQVSIMAELAGWLDGNATLLSQHLKFNHSSLSQAIESLLTSVFQAQALLNSKGPAIVHKLAEEFGKEFSKHIDSYLERVQTEAYNNVGRCWPLSQVYNSTIISTCNAIVDPFNGFWLSVGCTVLLFLPVIIVAVKLSTLYQKSDPYPGPLVEAEYLYDAYGDNRDSTPLANIDKKRKKKKKTPASNRDSRYDNSVSYSAHLSRTERSPAPPPTESVQWEVSGNPPRYQGPEYERPPPYYFPPTQQ